MARITIDPSSWSRQIHSFQPFINTNFVNDWSSLINLPQQYNNLEEYFIDKQKILGGKIKFIKNFLKLSTGKREIHDYC